MLCMIARKRLDCIEDKEGSHRGACGGDGCGDVRPGGLHAPTKYCAQYTNAAHERVDVKRFAFSRKVMASWRPLPAGPAPEEEDEPGRFNLWRSRVPIPPALPPMAGMLNARTGCGAAGGSDHAA